MLVAAIENFSLLLVLAYVLGKLPINIIQKRKTYSQIFFGGLFGGAAILSMLIPIQFYEGSFYDARAILIALSGSFGGYWAVAISGVIAGVFRYSVGGAGTYAGLAGIFLAIIFGAILVRFPLGNDQKIRSGKLALFGLIFGLVTAPTALLLIDTKNGLEIFQLLILTLPFIFMIAFPITDAVLNVQAWRVQIEESLRKNEETLREAQKIGRFGNWEYDLKTEKIIWSDEVYRLFERDPSLGPPNFKENMSYYIRESRDRLIAQIDNAVKFGNSYEDDYALKLPSGIQVYHHAVIRTQKDETGNVVKLTGTVQDITERKLAEEELRKTEALRRVLFKSMPMPTYCWQKTEDNFVLIDYNEAALLDTDGTIAENIGISNKIFYASTPEVIEDMDTCLVQGQTMEIELSRSLYEASKHQDQVITFVYCPPDIVMVKVEDVTEKKRIARELALSEQRFKDFAKTSADDLWETDAEHRYTFFSSDFSKNFPPLLGLSRWDNKVGMQSDVDWEPHKRDLDERRSFRDLRYVRVDNTGRSRHLRLNGDPVFGEEGEFLGYRGTAFDETREVEAREAARSSKEIFGEAVENISEGIVLWDADDHLLMVNRRYFEMYPDMQGIIVPGMNSTEYVQERVKRGYTLSDNLADKSKASQSHTTEQNKLKSVSFINIRDMVYQIRRERLSNGRRITFHTDITEEKQREEQLHQALKMEAVGQLTGGIAHDFNNILSAVLGNLELILQRVSSDEILSSRIGRAKASVLRGAELTSRLLAFSRKQNLTPTALYLNELINGMQDMLIRSLGEHISINIVSEPKLWPVYIDANLMENALLNLSINARDAMPGGGNLSIKCLNLTIEEVEKLGVEMSTITDCVCIEISDTGVGMPPEILERVLEPFFTTKDVGQGSGLGLSMVYGFVSQSGGGINVTSENANGTKVSLFLPKYGGEVEREDENEQGQGVLIGNGENILVVEDDPDVRDMTLSLLSRLGYKPYDCGDGRHLMKMDSDDVQRFDLLLSDVVLPNGISGPVVAKHAQKMSPEINVLLMTGYADRNALIDEDDELKYSIINKPFRANELSRVINDILIDSN